MAFSGCARSMGELGAGAPIRVRLVSAVGRRSIRDGHSLRGQPLGDLTWIKPQKVAPLDERDSSFGDEPSDMPHGNAEVRGNILDREKDGQLVDGRGRCWGGRGSGHVRRSTVPSAAALLLAFEPSTFGP